MKSKKPQKKSQRKSQKNSPKNSYEIFKKSQTLLVGGVNSPVRAFRSVGGSPPIIKRACGARLYDEDGCGYIDFVNSWGALILGHSHPSIVKAICEAASQGTSFGAPTKAEYLLARELQKAYPSLQKIRFVNSGTEATQSAIRLARGFTQREKILKFSGCYHGHTDSLLVKAGSGGATFGVPTSQGIPLAVVEKTRVVEFNDDEELEEVFSQEGKEIAAVIVEPIAANMGVVLPQKNFLQKLQKFCQDSGALLIFDEVITGFRVALGGAQKIYGISPDLTCLGKIIGGGLPVGAYGGRKDIMHHLSPEGGVYQAGTLSGNPLAMAAGLATLRELFQRGTYGRLKAKTTYFCERLQNILQKAQSPCQLNWTTGMFTLFFNPSKVTNFYSAMLSDTQAYARFFHAMLQKGIYLPPSQFEANFISLSHSKKELDIVLESMRHYFL